MKKIFWILLALFVGTRPSFADDIDHKKKARDALLASRSYNYTLNLLSEQLTADVAAKVKSPVSAVITKFTMSSNLPEEFENYSLLKIVEALAKADSKLKLIKCIECLTVNMEMHNGEVLLKKGVTDQKELDKFLTQYSANYYAELNVGLVGNSLILTMIVYSRKDNVIAYSNEIASGIYSIRDDGIIFGISIASMFVQHAGAGSLIGGQFYVGQRIARFGDVGFNFSSYTSSTVKSISGLGLMVDLNLNDMTGNYWKVGSLLITNSLGFASYRSNAQVNYSLGVKFKFGLIFHAFIEYALYQVLKFKDVEAPANQPFVIDPNKNFPQSIILGLGLDLG